MPHCWQLYIVFCFKKILVICERGYFRLPGYGCQRKSKNEREEAVGLPITIGLHYRLEKAYNRELATRRSFE